MMMAASSKSKAESTKGPETETVDSDASGSEWDVP